jgi:hypothetical protein
VTVTSPHDIYLMGGRQSDTRTRPAAPVHTLPTQLEATMAAVERQVCVPCGRFSASCVARQASCLHIRVIRTTRASKGSGHVEATTWTIGM